MAEIRINATGELKLYDSDESNYVSLKSAGTVSSNVAWVLPSADGSSGQALTTDGSGTLSWATASSADPSSADGDSVGTASAEWSDLFLADGGIIKFGNDQDVTLTHVADTGLTLNGTFTAANSMLINGSTPTLTIGDAGAEDTKIVFDGNAQDWHIGLDDSADDLVIGLGSSLGTTTHMSFDETGAILKPLQPAFSARSSSNQDVDTSADATVVMDAEQYDQNADYNTGTYIFTAPVTGRYQLNGQIVATDIDDEYLYFRIVTSNRNYGGVHQVPSTSGAEYEMISTSCLADMDAGDTAYLEVNSETDTSFELRDGECQFSGDLAC